MKKFILFLFLLTSVSFSNASAQDIGDEFADPTLSSDQNISTDPAPPGFKSSNEVTTEIQPGETPINAPTETTSATDLTTEFTTTEETNTQTQPLVLDEREPVNSGDVILEEQTDLSLSYKKRRGKHGVLFSFNYEKFFPVDYFSQYRDKYIEEFLGDNESIDLIGIELGYKLNFKLGSLSILGNYAQGSKSKSNYTDGTTTRERNLSVSRYGLSANLALDNITEEPWIVPYGQVGIHQFQVVEDDLAQDDAKSTTTQFAFNYRLGLLFQLNWIEKSIDPSTHVDGLRSSGLQNTFIDVYAMTHMASNETYDPEDATSEGDPDMSTGMELGVGLKMEF